MIQLFNDQGFKWKTQSKLCFKGNLYNGTQLKPIESINTELALINEIDDFLKWLKSTNGCFSLVFEKEGRSFAAVDIVRSLPLFYSIINEQIIITDNPIKAFGSSSHLSKNACIELESSAYLTGNQTLYEGVYQLQAGEYLSYKNNQLVTDSYYNFNQNIISILSFNKLKQRLVTILDASFTRLINSIQDRQVVIPLSGGYDSRLIALMLKKKGYTNIFTFTYGRKGNCELENSRRTAEILNLPWLFIEYNDSLIHNYLQDDIFINYSHFAGKACSMFYMQEYFAVKYLHDNHLIESDAVFVPGHSADVVAGSHLRENLSYKKNKKSIAKLIYKGTFFQNKCNKHRKYLQEKINSFINSVSKNLLPYRIFEVWEYKERQAKFIVNSASVFNYFGYEFRLPYWDLEIIMFFQTVPFEHKIYKKLYNSVLEEFYFNPNQIHFKKELQASAFQVKKQQIKNLLKPMMPLNMRLKYLEKNDWMAYSLITHQMLEDFNKRGIKYKFNADAYNSIISKWYTASFEEC